MPLAYLTFLTGIAISVVAIYYSVLGLAAIFAAAVIPIVVMGSILEVSKLVTAWWLKANWTRAPFLLKYYMLIAVVVLMVITSMGIFGFLSKAHTDQVIPSGDIMSKVALIDEKINNERETIANARTLLNQLDKAVTDISAAGDREIKLRDGGVQTQSAAERSLQVRRAQARDRDALTKTINESQNRIVKLQEEKAPIASQLRAVEAEVGPIKYIAKLIYGDNPDQNLLEKAVTWVIIIIVFVFDPLAVLLLLASQLSFQWAREEKLKKEGKNELVQENTPPKGTGEKTSPSPESDIGKIDELPIRVDVAEEANKKIAEIDKSPDVELIELEIKEVAEKEKSPLEEWNEMIQQAESEAIKESKDLDNVKDPTKTAKHMWKEEHPNDTIKRQEQLLNLGIIDTLPWEIAEQASKQPVYEIFPELQKNIKPEPDLPEQERLRPDFTEVIEPGEPKKK